MGVDVTHLLLGVTAALGAILLARSLVSRAFGARVAYLIWLAVPLALAVSLLPAPARALLSVPVVYLVRPIDMDAASLQAAASAFDTQFWLASVWLAGLVVFAAFQALQQRAFVRRIEPLARISAGTYISRRTEIGPCVIGAFRPRIVLPSNLEERYTAEERQLILAHERIHIARRDPLVNLCAAMLRALFWFHPLVHLAARYFRMDQELACDAAVLEARPQDSRRYAQAILKTQLPSTALPAGCAWQSHTVASLKRRIAMLTRLNPSLRRRRLGIAAVSAGLIAAATFVWASKSPTAMPQTAVLTWPADEELEKYYPEQAIEAGVEGNVRLTVMLDKQGRPTDTLVLEEYPLDQGFGAAASSLAHLATYSNPGGAPAPVTFNVRFALADAAAPGDQQIEKERPPATVSLTGLIKANGGKKPLVLVGGKPVVPTFDVESIALSGIERIEVLPNDATAAYGPAGANGVINIVLKTQSSGG